MKQVLKKIGSVLQTIFGYMIAVCLLAGGLSFVGFLVAMIIGGNAATAICLFLKETYLPIVIYCSSLTILLGLLAMYLTREKALTVEKEKKRK